MDKISRRSFLAGVGLLAATKGRAFGLEASELNFLVLGDWGRGSENQRKVAIQMAKSAKAISADFVITTGDNFYPRGVENVEDPRWKNSFEDIYSEPALQIPWYAVLGNHDHKGSVEAQIAYSDVSPRWKLPASYHKLTLPLSDGRQVDFFFLDTEPIESRQESWFPQFFDKSQLVWLEKELAASKALWKIAVGHHAVFSGGKHDGRPMIEVLKPLFDKYGVQIYLNGHDHTLEHVVVDKTHYLTCGAGSKPRSVSPVEGTRYAIGNRLGFMTARLTPDAMEFTFIDDQGRSLYSARIPAIP